MLIDLKVKNCFIFKDEVIFSMNSDMRNKRFFTNVHLTKNYNILKTAGIFGPNNSGKTCFVKIIKAIKNILLNNKPFSLKNNFLSKNSLCELEFSFLHEFRKFKYSFKYDSKEEVFLYEKFSECIKSHNSSYEIEDIWIEKDIIKNIFRFKDNNKIKNMLQMTSKDNIIIYLISENKDSKIDEMKKILINFADKIDIINMNNIPLSKTIEIMKNKNNIQKRVVEFIKNADIYLENIEYDKKMKNNFDDVTKYETLEEKVLINQFMDHMFLFSTYKGIKVPSMFYDSTGTKKITALASYVVEGLEKGRILIVDELDNSIHFKITRAIVSMFNNELNNSSQLIFTLHDVNLMDCKKMFRKEQLWFVHKDEERVYLYSLADFTAKKGVRETSDVVEKYKKGIFGAIPEPDLISSLIDIKESKN